ncbi:hypothetical protein DLJ74_06175 [Gracilibacillus dipsosauri]|uniref:Uncharacterized protein n=1 Tax=Gracilibacillus dipsosauri TaxID=178340 RepID=A0A317L1Z9_9BACI|nr:hypothetical protein DLJ74_06175 [Gracilibacillus dipsosauri]
MIAETSVVKICRLQREQRDPKTPQESDFLFLRRRRPCSRKAKYFDEGVSQADNWIVRPSYPIKWNK